MTSADATPDPVAALDRHALVMTLWLPAGTMAAALMHYGLGPGNVVAIGCAFLAILAGFVGHIIVNTVTGVGFTSRELALGLVLYLAALLAFGLGALLDPSAWEGRHWVTAGGFFGLLAAFVFYLVTARGTRGAFEGFDAIRRFRTAGRDPAGGRS